VFHSLARCRARLGAATSACVACVPGRHRAPSDPSPKKSYSLRTRCRHDRRKEEERATEGLEARRCCFRTVTPRCLILLTPLVGATLVCVGCAVKSTSKTAFVNKANTLCQRYDSKIKAAEDVSIHFSTAAVAAMDQEVASLQALGPPPSEAARLKRSFAEYRKARASLISGYFSIRTTDEHLLAAQQAARQAGVHCSFGAVPTLGLP
jgi:hypothetical protein